MKARGVLFVGRLMAILALLVGCSCTPRPCPDPCPNPCPDPCPTGGAYAGLVVVTFEDEIRTYWNDDGSGVIDAPGQAGVEVVGERIVVIYPGEVRLYNPDGDEADDHISTTGSITTTVGGNNIVVRYEDEMRVYNLYLREEVTTNVQDQISPLAVRAADKQVIEIHNQGESTDFVRVFDITADLWGSAIEIDSGWTDAEVIGGLFFLVYADRTKVYEISGDTLDDLDELPPVHNVIR